MEREERPGPRPKRKRSPTAAVLYKLGPALAISGLMLFGFYAICIRLAVQQVIYENNRLRLGLTFIIAFLICQLFFWLSYFRCVFSDPGRVPPREGELETPPPHTDNGDPDDEPTTPGYCDKCDMWKPPRAHHCRICEQCTLRMDHHCGVVDNCIGHKNQKYFVVMLTWVWITCGNALVTIITKFVIIGPQGWKLTEYLLCICIFFCCTYGIALMALAGMHYRFILLNLNTIEDKKSARKARGGRQHVYNISPWQNWVSVCGANPLLWLLPVYSTPGDGTSWETAVELPDTAGDDTEALTNTTDVM